MNPDDWGLYLHIPWCRIRCPYCAFVIAPDRQARFAELVDAMIAIAARRSDEFSGDPVTVYLGGGTPSRMPIVQLTRLLQALRPAGVREVTIEANPEDVEPAWLDGIEAAGVTRVSLGVQTLDPASAKKLGRAHTPDDARRALTLLKTRDLPVSIDVMFGLPDQTPDAFARDLDEILAFEPQHLSAYGLTIEPGTPYERAVHAGRLHPSGEDDWATMYEHLVARAAKDGLLRYEISNFAKPGFEAIHNSGYWQGRPYLGIGPGAHSLRADGARWHECLSIDHWFECSEPRASIEHPTPTQRATDLLISGLRAMAGLDLPNLAALTGQHPDPRVISELIAHHLLHTDGTRLALTHAGTLVADAVTRRLVSSLSHV